MMKKLLFLSFLFVGVLFVQASFAQTGTLTGTVTEAETGEAVPGANVFIPEIQRGASTNAQGEYSIGNLPVGMYTLRVTFIGYKANIQQVQVQSGQNEVNIAMESGEIGLDELVVTGYGTETKRELTGSITSINSDAFEDVPVQNTESILQGRAAGVKVTSTSGTPGSGFNVQVRGQSSINAGSQPLYIVDGVQVSFSNQNQTNDNTPLNAIPPENIQSIEVLKDAAAASIYGAQAGNGVVLITTKRGTANDTEVSFSVNRGATSNIQNNEYFGRDQFVTYFLEAVQYDNPGASPEAVENFFRSNFLPLFGLDTDTPFAELPNTDWFDFNNRTGVTQSYRATISGGNDNTQYRISSGYENADGYIRENNFQNYSLNGNFDQQVSSKFSTRLNVNLSSQKFVGPCQDGFFINCPISQASFSSPLARPFLEDGSFSPFFPLVGASNNPAIQLSNERVRETDVLQILGSIAGTYNFQPWLSLTSRLGVDFRQESETLFSSPVAAPGTDGSLTEIIAPTTNFITTTTLNFSQSFDEVNNISGLAGFEYRRDFTRQVSATGNGFPNTLFRVLNTTATPTGAAGFNNEFRQAGYFGQLKYNYDQRYFAKFAARYDGSSRFGEDNRFGFFPAGSVAWSISDEEFFNSGVVESLKLRASYGITGNSAIGRFAALGLFSTSGSFSGSTALRPTQLANQNLTWEKSTTLNLGLDYSLFNGRLSGSVDVYQKDNSDLLLNQPLPRDSGFGSITRNVGEVRNEGIEFAVSSVNLRAGDFQWNSRFNISVNRNEVLALSEGEDMLNPAGLQPVAVGHSIDAWRVIRYAGVNPADGRPFWYDKNGELTYRPDFDEDAVFFDGAEEDAFGGFGNTFRYKGLSLSAFLQFSYGQTAQPQQVVAFGISQVGGSFTNGIEQRLTDAWREPGDIEPFPAPTRTFFYPESEGYFITSSDKLFDASYIRLKDVTLAYSLPTSLTQRINVRNVRFHVSGLNLVTWTSYIGFDPEVAGDLTQASIPVGRTVTGGIEVQF